MLNTVINFFLFKNFIALWRHLAKTQHDEIFKQKVNDCVQHIILQKSTNFHANRSWSFRNICNEIGWPWPRFFCSTLYTVSQLRCCWASSVACSPTAPLYASDVSPTRVGLVLVNITAVRYYGTLPLTTDNTYCHRECENGNKADTFVSHSWWFHFDHFKVQHK